MIFRRDVIWLLVFFALAIFLFFFAVAVGSVDIPVAQVFRVLFGMSIEDSTSIFLVEDRFRRTINALMAGGGLSVLGLILQSYFRNPLAGPGVLGISSGASFGVALAIMMPFGFLGGVLSQYALGLIGAFAVILLLIFINKWIKGVTLLVVGLMIGYFTSAFVSTLLNSSTDAMMRRYMEWSFGSFGMTEYKFFWFYIAMIFLLLIFIQVYLPKVLNIWVLGEQILIESGYNPRRVRLIILIVIGLATALITVHCGPISFVGIAVPQVARMIIKSTNHSVLIPASLLLGGILSVCADTILRTVDIAIPLNGILALFGAPIIIYVIVNGSRRTVNEM